MTFRIAIDMDLCQGHGVCESEAPDLFTVGRDRKVEMSTDTPDDSLRRAAQLAVKYCPTHALTIVDEGAT